MKNIFISRIRNFIWRERIFEILLNLSSEIYFRNLKFLLNSSKINGQNDYRANIVKISPNCLLIKYFNTVIKL